MHWLPLMSGAPNGTLDLMHRLGGSLSTACAFRLVWAIASSRFESSLALPRRYANHRRPWRNVEGHDRSCADACLCADSDTREDDASRS